MTNPERVLNCNEVLPIQYQLKLIQQPNTSTEFPWETLNYYLGNRFIILRIRFIDLSVFQTKELHASEIIKKNNFSFFSDLGLTVKVISGLINIPYRTIRYRMKTTNSSSRPYDDLADKQVDRIVSKFLRFFPKLGKLKI